MVVLIKVDSAIIINHVPAEVCDQYGEFILSSNITKAILNIAMEVSQ